jgi:hypothetical protein
MKSIDWLSIRDVMLESLYATFRWASCAEESQQVDYDNCSAAEHLAAIVKARDTFGRANRVLNANDVSKLGPEQQPSDPCAISNSMERLTVFDLLAQASARAGTRPDFGIFATAHEAAFTQLLTFNLRLEFEIRNAIERAGISDKSIEDIEDLRRCSPEELRDTLFELEKGMFMQRFLDRSVGRDILRPWIIREWADVSAIPPQTRSNGKRDGSVKAIRQTTSREFDMAQCRQIIIDDTEMDQEIDECGDKMQPRLVVSDGEYPQATVDGDAIAMTKREAELICLLLDAHGEFKSLTAHGFRSRDVEGLPDPIRKFVESQPGAGTRIPLAKLFARQRRLIASLADKQ